MRGCFLALAVLFLVAIVAILVVVGLGFAVMAVRMDAAGDARHFQAETDHFAPDAVVHASRAKVILLPVVFLGVLFLLVVLAVSGALLRGRQPAYPRERGIDRDRLIQEMFQGFDRLNERVEALETILLDQFKKR